MKSIRILILLLVICTSSIQAQVSLPGIFSDNMVLQRNTEVNFWGWASPSEEVKLVASWNPEDTLTTIGSRQAKWTLKLKTPAGPGPYTITITGYNTITFKNVLVGEVWLASGQSNMEWSASAGIDHGEEEIANATNPNIRFFNVPRKAAIYPQDDVKGNWVASTPETMKYFSAIAYFFGKKLNEELDVPIGLISSNWGGTPAEIWISKETFDANPVLYEGAEILQKEQWGPNEPSRAYNGMIHPLVPYTLAGTLWYQGETNAANSSYYEALLKSLIKNWRTDWDADFPFYFAQIAPYNYGEGFAGVEVRDAQRRVLAVPNTGMVVLGDLGEENNIHPKNKIDVGLRFANLALTKHYQVQDKLAESPLVDHVEKVKKGVAVHFCNAKGLHLKGVKKSELFEVAGADKVFTPAKAKLKGDTVFLKSTVKDIKYVRYAWSNIATPDLFNSSALPASSFQVQLDK